MSTRPRLAITQGDPLGIGPEVLLRALADDAAGDEALDAGGAPLLEVRGGVRRSR